MTRIPYRVEMRDLDSFRHLSHVRVLELVEIVRVRVYDETVGVASLAEHDLIMAELAVRYHAQGSFRDGFVLCGRISGVGTTSLAFDYEIAQADGTTLVTARTYNVRFDDAANAPRPVGEALARLTGPDGASLPHPRALPAFPVPGSLLDPSTTYSANEVAR